MRRSLRPTARRRSDIAELLQRSVIAQDDTYLRMIGAYNRAGTGATPVSPPLSQRGVSEGRAGALLDLIALPESGGNYNAWYGNATQDGVDLATLTVDQVRALQADLVRSQGGSAIGRYQLLDETLDGLVERLGVAGSEPFTPALQDRLALAACPGRRHGQLAGRAGSATPGLRRTSRRCGRGSRRTRQTRAITPASRATGQRLPGTAFSRPWRRFAAALRAAPRCPCRRDGRPASGSRWSRRWRS